MSCCLVPLEWTSYHMIIFAVEEQYQQNLVYMIYIYIDVSIFQPSTSQGTFRSACCPCRGCWPSGCATRMASLEPTASCPGCWRGLHGCWPKKNTRNVLEGQFEKWRVWRTQELGFESLTSRNWKFRQFLENFKELFKKSDLWKRSFCFLSDRGQEIDSEGWVQLTEVCGQNLLFGF